MLKKLLLGSAIAVVFCGVCDAQMFKPIEAKPGSAVERAQKGQFNYDTSDWSHYIAAESAYTAVQGATCKTPQVSQAVEDIQKELSWLMQYMSQMNAPAVTDADYAEWVAGWNKVWQAERNQINTWLRNLASLRPCIVLTPPAAVPPPPPPPPPPVNPPDRPPVNPDPPVVDPPYVPPPQVELPPESPPVVPGSDEGETPPKTDNGPTDQPTHKTDSDQTPKTTPQSNTPKTTSHGNNGSHRTVTPPSHKNPPVTTPKTPHTKGRLGGMQAGGLGGLGGTHLGGFRGMHLGGFGRL
jgi:hypothetical protein